VDIIAQSREIYSRFCDDVSREIFENRVLHYLTYNHRFFEETVYIQYPEYRSFMKKYSKLVLYGAGIWGEQVAQHLSDRVIAICDSDRAKHGTFVSGHKVISPYELVQKHFGTDVGIFISVVDDELKSEIKGILVESGFPEDQVFHINKTQYFDDSVFMPDIIDRHISEEVFVDAGSYDFNSSLKFVKWCNGAYKKIIAFEPNPEQFPVCMEKSRSVSNAIVYPFGLWNENTELIFDTTSFSINARISDDLNNYTKIKTRKLDDLLKGEKATFIKMDVEGAELKALKGAESTILVYHPKMAICVYHKIEDIIEIPAYILSLHNDYKFYLRQYSLWGTEVVLYAI